MAGDHPLSDPEDSGDDVMLLMTLRTVVELMGDEIDSDDLHPSPPDAVVDYIASADPLTLKRLILLTAVELTERLKGADDNCADR